MQKIIKAALIITLVLLSYKAITYGIANIAFEKAEQQLTFWQKAGTASRQVAEKNQALLFITINSYQNTLAHINRAIFWQQKPQYLTTKAKILEWGVRSSLAGDNPKNLQQAKALYLQAAKLQPTWPTTWASLALLKWHLQELDQELLYYLVNADIFGKNSAEVHTVWAQFGIAISNNQNPQLRQLVKPHLDKIQYHIDQGLKHPRSKQQIQTALNN